MKTEKCEHCNRKVVIANMSRPGFSQSWGTPLDEDSTYVITGYDHRGYALVEWTPGYKKHHCSEQMAYENEQYQIRKAERIAKACTCGHPGAARLFDAHKHADDCPAKEIF